MEIRAFRWYGGKNRMSSTISSLLPEHETYVEPFGGSAAVLLNHPRSHCEIYNDLDSEVYCFVKTLADKEKGKELIREICELHFGKEVFDFAKECKLRNFAKMSDIEKATAVYILISQSFNAVRKGFSRKLYKSTCEYQQDNRFNIPQVYERLKGVQVLNQDGIDLIAEYANNENAFIFADPPYRQELRGVSARNIYQCEMPRHEQIRMLKTIRAAKCKIMLCGYRSTKDRDLYDVYLLPYGWKCYRLAEMSKSAQTKVQRDVAEEFIWVNYKLPEMAKYVISLKEYNSLLDEREE